ncbi:Uu.00g096760.m01.CDS01 [Anthostomella pinea]|uniref:Uu.00g096760.m01.CDS01 n=1 Tax=Anthostomella pinea TaxID=933095 RepID=A0AAI8VCU2_9PEZI|nr:Uu.00g096760.m01.CDS01 [Anthostomella pinea]
MPGIVWLFYSASGFWGWFARPRPEEPKDLSFRQQIRFYLLHQRCLLHLAILWASLLTSLHNNVWHLCYRPGWIINAHIEAWVISAAEFWLEVWISWVLRD